MSRLQDYRLDVLAKPLKAAERVHSLAGPVVALGVVIAILYFGRVFFITSLVAVIIAFILEPFVAILTRFRLPRPLASFVVCSLAIFFLYLLGIGAYTQVSGLMDDLPKYSQRISEIVETVQQRVEKIEQQSYDLLRPGRRKQEQLLAEEQRAAEEARKSKRRKAQPAPPAAQLPAPIPEVRIHEDRNPVTDYIYSRLSSFYEILLMSSFVPFLVYFMLSWREHINNSFLQFFEGEDRLAAARSLQGMAEMVRAFVVGNFVLAILLAFWSTLAFWMLGLPYAFLVGPLSGFLSLVPYVGLPMALIPPVLAALPSVNTIPGYLLIVAIVAGYHLLALNLLYPKIVGSRVHLNPLVVTFSLMLWGFLWNAAGLLLAIPLTAAIKAVCDNVKGLQPFGKLLGD